MHRNNPFGVNKNVSGGKNKYLNQGNTSLDFSKSKRRLPNFSYPKITNKFNLLDV